MNPAGESSGASLESANECAICMDEITKFAIVLPCGHEFHPDCIAQWALDKSKEAIRAAIDNEAFDNDFLFPTIICPLYRDNPYDTALYCKKENAQSSASLQKFAKTLQLYMTALYNVKIYQPMVERMVDRLLNTQDDTGRDYSSFERVPASFWDTQESLGGYQVFLQSTSEVISEITHHIMAQLEQPGVGNNVDKVLQQKISDLEYKLEQMFHLLDECRPYSTKMNENGMPRAFNDKTRLPVTAKRLKALPNLDSRLEKLDIQYLLGYYAG